MALIEGKHTAEFLLSEGNGSISREEVVIASTAPAMVPGTVVGVITASGKYAPYSNADTTTGLGVAAGILYSSVDDRTADQKAVVIVRDAEVVMSELTGIDAPGRADLKAIGIICR